MNGTITEVEFFHGLEQLHEGVGDKLVNFVGKMLTKLKSYFNDIAKYGKKLLKALGWLVDKTKGIYDKYPNVVKALVILTVMVALILVSTAAVAAGGEPISIDPTYLNVVIGYANETEIAPKSLAMLIDAKDGTIDDAQWNANEVKNVFSQLKNELTEALNGIRAKQVIDDADSATAFDAMSDRINTMQGQSNSDIERLRGKLDAMPFKPNPDKALMLIDMLHEMGEKLVGYSYKITTKDADGYDQIRQVYNFYGKQ